GACCSLRTAALPRSPRRTTSSTWTRPPRRRATSLCWGGRRDHDGRRGPTGQRRSILTRCTSAGRQLSPPGAQAIPELAARIDPADTARPPRNALTRGAWLAVGQEVTTAMLEGADVEDALALIASRLCEVAEADAACLVLQGVGDDWVIEFADGEDAED